MPMRLQEVHPSMVHMPIALLPLAVGTDLVAVRSRDRGLARLGRIAIELAAGSALVAAVTGLVAQEEVVARGPASDQLVTHRNLNLAALAAVTGMAVWRARNRPTGKYVGLGGAVIGTMLYTAYLGGRMVYEHGVGVKPAGGLKGGTSPELTPGQAGEVARAVAADVKQGLGHAAQDIGEGRIAPALGD